MPEMIHLKAPNGHVIGMTLPLHESIEFQWRHGELQQVNADGSPWNGAVETPAGDAPAGDEAALVPDVPVRPRDSAHRSKWQAHAVALGACTAEEVEGMSRAELIELTTPGEMLPSIPEV